MYGKLPAMVFKVAPTITRFELCTKSPLAEFPHITQRAIRALSPDLHTLILATPEAEQMLLLDRSNDPEALLVFSPDSVQKLGISRAPMMIDLSQLFPKLQSLSVLPTAEFSILESVDFCVLRDLSLTNLQLCTNTHINDDILPHLPASLKSLGLGPGVKLSASASPLPPHMEALRWNLTDFGAGITQQSLEMLPPTLTELYTTPVNTDVPSKLPIELFRYLPCKLRVIHTIPMMLTRTTALPPMLEQVQMHLSHELSTTFHTLLPPTLTKLFLLIISGGKEDRTFDWPNILPPTLVHFTLLGRRLHPEGLVRPLPLNLTNIQHSTGQSLEGTWPDSLTRLSVSGPAKYDVHPLTLPSRLTDLSAKSFTDKDLLDLPSTLLSFRAEVDLKDAILPNSLTSFTAVSIMLSAASIRNLPRTLQKLEILTLQAGSLPFDQVDCDWPPTLRSFTFHRLPLNSLLKASPNCLP